jgi:hypothetical protein
MLKAWGGPALAAIGAVVLAAVEFLPASAQSTLAWWIATSALAPVRVLPLLGLGVALALVDFYLCAVSLLLFGCGIAIGLVTQDRFVAALAALPQAASHDFLTGPISCLAIGLALAAGYGLRRWLLPIAALIAGAMLVFAIRVTDPSLHNWRIPLAGITIALWIVAAITLIVRAFRRDWFTIPARIVGSWLIAIGLLYGGASLMPRRSVQPPPPPPATPQAAPPGFEREIPGIIAPEQGPTPGVPPDTLRR